MKFDKNNRTEIRVLGPDEGQEISIFLPWDANLEEWTQAFKCILIHQTFSEELINQYIFNEQNPQYDYRPNEDRD